MFFEICQSFISFIFIMPVVRSKIKRFFQWSGSQCKQWCVCPWRGQTRW
jgi:hypothetical protein